MKHIRTLALVAMAGAALLAASCKKEEQKAEPVAAEAPAVYAHETITLSGTVDKYPVVMVLQCAGDTITGYDYYVRGNRKASADLQLKGTLSEDGTMELFEWVESNGLHSSHFLGCFSADKGFQGKFDRNDGTEMMFSFTIDSISVDAAANTPLGFSRTKPADFAQVVERLRNAPVSHSWFVGPEPDVVYGGDEGEVYDGDGAENSTTMGEGSIDSYLDSYERCLNKYVAFMKKMDRDDPTALVEAGRYYQELYELSQKADKVKGQMSDAQRRRLLRIQQNFNKALEQFGQP